MADSEFEEFRQIIDKLPSHLKAPTAPFYSLVPGLDELETTSSKSDASSSSDTEEENRSITPRNSFQPVTLALNSNSEDDEIGDGLRTVHKQATEGSTVSINSTAHDSCTSSPSKVALVTQVPPVLQVERRRRKLPEIPKNKKPSALLLLHGGPTSLAEELGGNMRLMNGHGSTACPQPTSRSVLAMKCGYLMDEDSSPDSDRLHSLGDVDSGHSTAHSPTDFKSMSPTFPPPFGGVPYSQIEMLEATHRSLHKFIPRHQDELELEIGDAVYVQKEADDLWCEGVNLRTGKQGIFPSAYAVDLEYNDFDPETVKMKRERYLLGYLGSVETLAHKGTGVVCQAVKKIIGNSGDSPKAQSCILEISDQGLRMVERSRLQGSANGASSAGKGPCIDYFYSLKNVSFCAFHPRDHRYIGFITKHPTIQRFACHVFKGQESTRPVAEAVGRAFQRFYQQFIETAYPIEDIYIE